MDDNLRKSIIILIRGLPGSGKTSIAAALQDMLGKDRVVMLDPDATDYKGEAYLAHTRALTEDGVDKSLHPYRFLRAQAYQGIAERRIVIWNQPFTNLEIFNKMVDNFKVQAAEHNTELVILVVEVEIDPALAKERVLRRKQAGGHGPSDRTFERFATDYYSFADKGYRTVQVRGDDVESSVALIKTELSKLA